MQQQEQYMYEPPPQQYIMGQPPLQNQLNEGLLQYQLEADEIIDEFECLLLGKTKVFDNKTKRVKLVRDPASRPIISEIGMARIKTHLKSRLTKIYALSDFDEETIEKMTIDVGDNIIDMIEENWEVFEIKSSSDASLIVRNISDAVYSTLRKAHIGNYLKFLTTTSRISETHVGNQYPPVANPKMKSGGSILSKIFGR